MNINKLKRCIEQSGLTKSQIAVRGQISRTTLDNAIKGDDVKISTIEAIARVVGVESSYFFDEDDRKSAVANGARSVAAVDSNVTLSQDTASLLSEVEYLKKLLAEKERLIQILLKNDKI